MTRESRRQRAETEAEEYRQLVRKRTGLARDELQCPREKSEMTPCIARDGKLAVADAIGGAVCVGCDYAVAHLLRKEKSQQDALRGGEGTNG